MSNFCTFCKKIINSCPMFAAKSKFPQEKVVLYRKMTDFQTNSINSVDGNIGIGNLLPSSHPPRKNLEGAPVHLDVGIIVSKK